VFHTAIGACRIEWRGDRVTALTLLSRAADGASRGRAPAFVRHAQRAVVRHLAGDPQDLGGIPIDTAGCPPFHRAVYRAARDIPPGTTVSYGALARRAGSPGASRAVGQAMRRNPLPLIVPCHRVIAADGSPGGFSAAGGVATKLRLQRIERRAVAARARAREASWPFDVGRGRAHLRRRDPELGSAIRALGPVRYAPLPGKSPFPALFRAIVYQQLNGKAAGTILGRVLERFPAGRFPRPEEVLATEESSLRAAGLSRNKLAAVRDLAARVLDGTVPRLATLKRMDDEAIIERLTAVRGIGRWTAEMFLIFRLGRPDVLPVDDLGVRKGFGVIFEGAGRPTPAVMMERAERWRPYRTVATWYLYQAADTLVPEGRPG